MPDQWTMVSSAAATQSDEELKEMFGREAVISRVGVFNLIHLDNPSPEMVEQRVSEFDPNDIFEDDCPLCQMLRNEGGNVVYDDDL